MARTILHLQPQKTLEESRTIVNNILADDGYQQCEQNGEMIWTKGDVKTRGVKGIQIEYLQDFIKISGWIQGLVGGEVTLHGFASVLPKRSVRKTIDKISNALVG